MRFALAIPRTTPVDAARVRQLTIAAEQNGFDAIWFCEGQGEADWPDPFAPAAVAAEASTHVRIGISTVVGLSHPLYVAEDVAVLDLMSHGRVELACAPPMGLATEEAQARHDEAISIISLAVGARPFRFHGTFWQVPANIATNDGARNHRQVMVMPKPAQLHLPLWRLDSATPSQLPLLSTHYDEQAEAQLIAHSWSPVEAMTIDELGVGKSVRLAIIAPAPDAIDDTIFQLGRYALPRFRSVRLPPSILQAMDKDWQDRDLRTRHV